MKKILSALLLAAALSSAAFAAGPIELPDVPISQKRPVGDINDDGSVDNKDVVLLFRAISANTDIAYNYVYDVNKDNKINNKDVTALFRGLSK